MASPPVKGGESRRSLVQMDSMAGMDGKGGAVGKQIMAAAPETPVKPQEPLVASPSNTKKNAYLDFGKDDDVREASVKTLPANLETDADKAARLERRRIAEERMADVEAARRAHMALLIKELVHEVFVDGVVERWRILDMARRSEASARQFAADAVCFRMMGGYTEADDQDEVAGLPLKDWRRDNVPETGELEALKIKQAEHGTWMDRARKNVRNKFEGGTKEVIRNPRVVSEHYEYAGLEYKGGKQKRVECPNWDELYVGQLVNITSVSIQRKITYSLADKSGVLDTHAKGYPLDKSIEMCKGVILYATPDFEIKENDTYQPGVRISNYVCYPGGGAWVRWDTTKENDYVWSNRIEPCKEGNSPDEIDRRTDAIEKQDWAELDELVLSLTAQVKHLSNDVVHQLRLKVSGARMNAASAIKKKK